MKYYKLEHKGAELKEIGSFPQLEKLVNLGDYEKIGLMASRNPIIIKWVPPELGFGHKARQTTLLSSCISSAIFLILKNYFIDFLSDFINGPFQTWPMKVHYKKQVLTEYLLFHISYPLDNQIVNYGNSEFLVGKLGDWRDPSIRKPINVESHENYLNLIEVLKESSSNSQIRCNKLVLDFKNIDVDMFRLADVPFGSGYYISERLRDTILDKRFTGMDFLEIEEYEKKIEVKNAN